MSAVSLTNLLPSSLLDTTVQKTLGEEFSLCENRSMVFHWADFHETCGTIQDQIEANPSLREDFQRRQKAVERLGDISVWIRTNKKIHHTSMFELYQRYVLNQSGQLGNIDPFAPIEISFISGTGPFKSMAIAECFNKHTYQDFILVNLLK